MSNTRSVRSKMIALSLAVITFGAGIIAQSVPAEARGKRNNGDAALALGLFGVLAAGMLIAGSQQAYADGFNGGYGLEDSGPQLVHYPQRRRHHGEEYHAYQQPRHGFYGAQCYIETRHVRGRHGHIFTKQFRVCH